MNNLFSNFFICCIIEVTFKKEVECNVKNSRVRLKGNVLDLAIAVVMGAAFNKIISSLVENIIMPLIGKIFGSVDFAKEWSFWGIKYGLFIQSVIDFIIIAFALFIFVKIANTLMKKEEAEEEAVVEENVVLLTEIRDLLREKNNF